MPRSTSLPAAEFSPTNHSRNLWPGFYLVRSRAFFHLMDFPNFPSIKKVRTGDLLPYARNARTHSDSQVAQIAASIKEFGFTNPILTDGANGIIAGHGRLLAAMKLGMEEVPVIELEYLTKAQRQAYIIADNKLALNAGWNEELLAIEMKDLQDLGFDLGLTGFDDIEISKLFSVDAKAGLTDPDDVPDVPDEPITKPGDLWMLGDHRLYCGDSTSQTDVKTLMGGARADLLLTDPPYNVNYEGKTESALKIQNDSMDNKSFRAFLANAFTCAYGALKSGAVFYIWHAESEGFNFRGACVDAHLSVRQCLIWVKNSIVMGRQDYQWKHEPCLYGWKDGAAHLWVSDRKQSTILNFDRPQRNDIHPTMKPVALFEYQMLNNTKGGDIVLDLFAGSGTTLIAAERFERVAYLMEMDPAYCDVIVKRWEDFTGKRAELKENSYGQTSA